MSFNLRNYVENEWLKGGDFDDDERVVLTIANIYEHIFDSGETRPVLEFQERFKGLAKKLSLNVTRGKKIIALFGNDSDAAVGKRIVVYAGDVSYAGKAERTVVIAGYKGGPTAEPTPAPAEPVSDSDIPF